MDVVLRPVLPAKLLTLLLLLSSSITCIGASPSKVEVLDSFLGSDEIEALQAQVASDFSLQREQRDLIDQVRESVPIRLDAGLHQSIRCVLNKQECYKSKNDKNVVGAAESHVTTIFRSTQLHQDRYANEGEKYQRILDDSVGFIVLSSDNDGAYFQYGSDQDDGVIPQQIPLRKGRFLKFDGSVKHRTVVPSDNVVQMLGPFTIDGQALSLVGRDAFTACCDTRSGVCTDVLFEDCVADQLNIVRQGRGTTCSDPGYNCQTRWGACCNRATGACFNVPIEDCGPRPPRFFQGRETQCSDQCCRSDLTACCDTLTGICSDVLVDDCDDDGRFIQQGRETTCGITECLPAIGACCLDDGTCEELTNTDCMARTGGRNGQGRGVLCSETSCPASDDGACCLPDGGCDDGLNGEDCIYMNGGKFVEGSDCFLFSASCMAFEVEGGCCSGSRDGTCSIETPTNCEGGGGTYLGNNTPCLLDSCDQFGACCQPDGSCTVSTGFVCEDGGGTFQGDNIDCLNGICRIEPGACCIPTTGACLVVEETECNDVLDGNFQGLGTDCDTPYLCPDPIPTGACCIWKTQNCVTNTYDECWAVGGRYQGDDVMCDEHLCNPLCFFGLCW